MRIYIWLFLYLISAYGFATPILNYYPKCDYEVLEESTYQQKLVTKNWVNDVALTFSKVERKLQKKAKRLHANAILLVERDVIEPTVNEFGSKLKNAKKRLKYRAQFIKACQPIDVDNLKPTPVNSDGEKVSAASTTVSTIEFSDETTITLGPKEREPATLPNRMVSLDGAYGIALGQSKNEFKGRFGEATSVFNAENNITILGYGRYHWFVFDQNTLAAITTNNPWFNQSLINTIPFQSPFDDDTWEIKNLGKKNQSLPLDRFYGKTQLTTQNDSSSLTVYTLKSSSQEDNTDRTIDGYTLKLKNFDLASVSFSIPAQAKSAIQAYLFEKDNIYSSSTTSELLTRAPIGLIRASKTKTAYLISPSASLVFSGDQLIEFKIGESALNQFKNEQWAWGKFHYAQPIQEVEALLPDTAFSFQSKISLDTDNSSETFLFYEEDNQKLLFNISAKIFQTVD